MKYIKFKSSKTTLVADMGPNGSRTLIEQSVITLDRLETMTDVTDGGKTWPGSDADHSPHLVPRSRTSSSYNSFPI
jgi:hypothetical protein